MPSLEYLMPRFAHECWQRVGVPNSPGELKEVGRDDTEARGKHLFNVLDEGVEALVREAKPTMWAQAEAFTERLRAVVDAGRRDSPEFQTWAGLVTALYQGDLTMARISSEQIQLLDEDLLPALEASLPLALEGPDWPELLRSLHDGGMYVLRLRERPEGPVLGAAYAPCLLFPALQMPPPEEDSHLQKFQTADGPLSLRFDRLLERYRDQPGFLDSLAATVDELARTLRQQKAGNRFPDALAALAALQEELRRQGANPAAPQAGKSRQEARESLLSWRYVNPRERELGEEAGRVLAWRDYALRATAADGKEVLFIPEGLDPQTNPWLNQKAFPRVDVNTRYSNLAIGRRPDGRWFVSGAGEEYDVSDQYHLVSLHPEAPSELRILGGSLFVLEGDDHAVKTEFLDGIHESFRRRLTSRGNVTAILPLHPNLFRYFPDLLNDPEGLIAPLQGSLDQAASSKVELRLRLPLPKEAEEHFRQVQWSADLMKWKLEETRLPECDVWPRFRSGGGDAPWSCYFVRRKFTGGNLTVRFHGSEIRPRSQMAQTPQADSELYSIERLNSPPRLAEIRSAAGSEETVFGVLFLSQEPYKTVYQQGDAWEVGVDFGTTNTSAAYRRGRSLPHTLDFKAWAGPLLYARSADTASAPVPYPGWFLQGQDQYHRGFFATMLGYRRAVLEDSARLSMLEKPRHQTPADLGDLVGAFDLLGIKGSLALEMADPPLSDSWGVEDNLKWAAEDETDASEVRRRALRTAFLEMLLLHVCAEAYASTGRPPTSYTFTYPLSQKRHDVELFRMACGKAREVVEGLVAPDWSPEEADIKLVNESQAAFRAYLQSREMKQLLPNRRVVLIDVGGGTADYSVFTGVKSGGEKRSDICFLDSLVLAGNRFFEFLQEIRDDDDYKLLEQTQRLMFKDRLQHFPQLRELRDPEKRHLFRQFFNLRVSSMMPEKSPQHLQDSDLSDLSNNESAVAEHLSRRLDHYPTGHWMRALFNAVITHGLLLGLAPVPKLRPAEQIDLVLAGNGWGLLHQAGVLREETALAKLVLENFRTLRDFLGYYVHKDQPDSIQFPSEDRLHVRFMDRIVEDTIGGKGVYSKDIVAGGGILEERHVNGTAAKGIFGYNLRVVPGTDVALKSEGEPPYLELPWHTTVAKEHVDDLVKRWIAEQPGIDIDNPFARPKLQKLRPHPQQRRPSEAQAYIVPQQLLILELLRTGGAKVRHGQMLSIDSWEEWNDFLVERAEELLDIYGEASSRHSDEESTSLIRNVWEYPFVKRVVRRELYDRMKG